MPDIDAIERLLCQRYNVHALDGGELANALALARGGDTQPLREALEVRELYRWRGPVFECLGVEDTSETPEAFAAEPDAEVAEEEPSPVATVPIQRRRGRRR